MCVRDLERVRFEGVRLVQLWEADISGFPSSGTFNEVFLFLLLGLSVGVCEGV